jgi:peptidoglycan/xylan/chitin deacetylase (PgdA/CDA1 family)
MIITYHHVAPVSYSTDKKYIENSDSWYWTITPDELLKHIEILKKKKYTFLGLDEYYENLKKYNKEEFKTAVITFDDGWVDNYLFAFPLLSSLDITGTFFITTAHLVLEPAGQIKVSKEMIFEMHKKGMVIGSHTVNHVTLPLQNFATIEQEVTDSKGTLENILKQPVRFFAYPGGAFNASVLEIVKKAGYDAACSVISPAHNTFDDRFHLFRNHFSNKMNSLADYYRLNNLMINALECRTRKKIYRKLNSANLKY